MNCPECLPPVVWWKFWSAESFLPRSACGNWPDWLMAEWVGVGIVILLLYSFIAVQAVRIRKRSAALAAHDPTFPRWAFKWIAGFFVACGVAHALNPSAFFWPAYVLHIKWEILTAIVSARGAVGVYRLSEWVVVKLDTLTAERDAARRRVARIEEVVRRQVAVTAIPWESSRNPAVIQELIEALGADPDEGGPK